MQVTIVELEKIREIMKRLDPIRSIEDGFIAYSQGKVMVPPVGELVFDDPPGDMHIKYGYIRGDEHCVVKIATGFYENARHNLPTGSGLMLIFSQKTGELAAILLDQGHLTNVRTAAAGAVVAKYLAPKEVRCIGIFGAGTQGRMQLQYLKSVLDCREAVVWGLNGVELDSYRTDMEKEGFRIRTTTEPSEVADACNFIVTATPSKRPLLRADQVRTGTHITAVGSDTPDKIELDPAILRAADLVVVDSIPQSMLRGEVFRAISAGFLERERILELGNVVQRKELQRTSEDQITVADLTGVAIQDIQIAKAVYEAAVAGGPDGRS